MLRHVKCVIAAIIFTIIAGGCGYNALQQLEGTENRINIARQRHNKAVKAFIGKIRSLPYSLTNSLLLHLDRKEYLKPTPAAPRPRKSILIRSGYDGLHC